MAVSVNYLFPRQLATVAKGAAMKQHEGRIAREAAKGAQLLSAAQDSAEKLRGKVPVDRFIEVQRGKGQTISAKKQDRP